MASRSRPRLFLGSAGSPADGLGRCAAGRRERILLRACILIAKCEFAAADAQAARRAADARRALQELTALGLRKATASGDGFADGFPTEALAAILKTRLARPTLSEADWVEIRTHYAHETKCII